MIKIPKELQEQWEKEEAGAKASGAKFATEDEAFEVYKEVVEEVGAEIDEELRRYREEHPELPEWAQKILDTDDPAEKAKLWNERHGDEIQWVAEVVEE